MVQHSVPRKAVPPKSGGDDRDRLDDLLSEQDQFAAQTSEAEPTMQAADAADYIAQMAAELARIARTAKLDPLAYFLEMARIEAKTCLRRLEGRR